MRKTILTAALGAALIAVSMAQAASAAERQHVRKVEQFRNANAAIVVVTPSEPQVLFRRLVRSRRPLSGQRDMQEPRLRPGLFSFVGLQVGLRWRGIFGARG